MQCVSAQLPTDPWPLHSSGSKFQNYMNLVRSLFLGGNAQISSALQKHCQLSARNWTALEASAWLRATCTEWGQTKWRRGCITKWTAMAGTQSMSYCFCAPLPIYIHIYIYCMNFPKTFLIQYKSTQLRKSSSHLGIILNHWLGDIQLRRVLGLHARGRRFCIFSLVFFCGGNDSKLNDSHQIGELFCFILCSWCWILNVYIVSCLLLETSIMS